MVRTIRSSAPRSSFRMALLTLAVWATMAPGILSAGSAEARDRPVLTAAVLHPPQPLHADGGFHLAYELEVRNLAPEPRTLEQLDVFLDGALSPHQRWQGEALAERIGHPGDPERLAPRRLEESASTVLFLWLRFEHAADLPGRLHHRLTWNDGQRSNHLDLDVVQVSQDPPRLLSPPLAGERWVAANGPHDTSGHRRAAHVLEGRPHFAQRFAIDWARYGAGDTLYDGERSELASWPGYSAPVLAVDDATVHLVRDGAPDNRPGEADDRYTPETIGGNVVGLDLGEGIYAYYAHLRPGSLRVGEGERVRRGQILAEIGNSGRSSGPHLHFHLSDAPTLLGGSGLPYIFDSFVLQAELDANFDPIWRRLPETRRREMPRAATAVAFPTANTPRTPEQPFFAWSKMAFAPEVHALRRERLAAALDAKLGTDHPGILLVPSAPGRSHGETFRQRDDFLYLTGLELPDSVLALVVDTHGTDDPGAAPRAILFVPDRDARFESPARPNDFPGRELGLDPELARRSGITDIRSLTRLNADLGTWAEAGHAFHLHSAQLSAEPRLFQPWTPEHALRHHLAKRHPNAVLHDASDSIAAQRMVKDAAEITALRRAVEATIGAIRDAASTLAPGVTERALAGEFEAGCKRRGAQRQAFDPIVKSGPNSLWPWRVLAAHYGRRDRAAEADDLVIFDVGCEVDRYASDIGRTFPVSGRFTDLQRSTLEMATHVADAVIAAVRPGVTFAELRQVAEAAIPADERRYMQTGLFYGHHIGLDVGDPSVANMPLEPGMVFTVEPWYYNHERGLSVFVEDNILVTKTGAENLSRGLPRNPDALEEVVGARPIGAPPGNAAPR